MMQEILAGMCFLAMAGYFFMMLVEKKPHWFQTRTQRRLREIEDSYNRLRVSRRQTLHHYYWAESAGESDKKQRMEKQLTRIDDEMDTMRKDYQLLEQGKIVPLKKI